MNSGVGHQGWGLQQTPLSKVATVSVYSARNFRFLGVGQSCALSYLPGASYANRELTEKTGLLIPRPVLTRAIVTPSPQCSHNTSSSAATPPPPPEQQIYWHTRCAVVNTATKSLVLLPLASSKPPPRKPFIIDATALQPLVAVATHPSLARSRLPRHHRLPLQPPHLRS